MEEGELGCGPAGWGRGSLVGRQVPSKVFPGKPGESHSLKIHSCSGGLRRQGVAGQAGTSSSSSVSVWAAVRGWRG